MAKKATASGGARESAAGRKEADAKTQGSARLRSEGQATGEQGGQAVDASKAVPVVQVGEANMAVQPATEPSADKLLRLGPDGEGPIDIAGENIPGDPALNNRGGLMEREMESTAERDSRAASQSTRTATLLADKLGQDQSDEDPFELMSRVASITSGPRYARNQTFSQIRLLWAQAQAGARSFQERFDRRFEREQKRQEKRA